MTVPLLLTGCSRKPAPEPEVVDLRIESDGDFLAYKPDVLTCRTGVRVRLTFHHAGQFLSAQHNWVLAYPHQMDAVAKDVEETDGVIAKGDRRVIAATMMCDRGGTTAIEFTAPPPGDYPFFCSTPGHAEDMNGVLHVTP